MTRTAPNPRSGIGHPGGSRDADRPNRQLRHQHGKSDPLDAESAARAVLAGQATACPKTGTGTAEMIRQIKVARDTAVKARAQAMLTLKTLIVNAPAALREQLDRIDVVRRSVNRRALRSHSR